MDYNQIKETAAGLKAVRVIDLLAMAPKNDPFYTGRPADIEMGRWFHDVWQRAGYTSNVHLRRVHYWCVSQPRLLTHRGAAYANTIKMWKYLSEASKQARYMGLVNIGDIVDHKNPAAQIRSDHGLDDDPEFYVNTPDLERPGIYTYGYDRAQHQPCHLEIWCEKSTMNDVLAPLAERYGVNLATFEGEASITACHDLAERIACHDKPVRIFYISDFDPAGNSMPVAVARKLEYLLVERDIGNDVRLMPIALTAKQISDYDLPRTPIKEKETRGPRFEEAFGVGAVELDALEALHPGVLARIVRAHIEPFFDQIVADAVQQAHADLVGAVRLELDLIAKKTKYVDAMAVLDQMHDEMMAVDVHADDFTPPLTARDPDADGAFDWLFDTERGYVEQIGFYKLHQGKYTEWRERFNASMGS